MMMKKAKNFRKRKSEDDEDETQVAQEEDDTNDRRIRQFARRSGLTKIDEYRLALEEIKFLQKLRERKSGVPAIVKTGQTAAASNGNNAGGLVSKGGDKAEGDGEKDDLVLQDTFALETAVLDEDPHMYVPLIPHYACAVFLLSSRSHGKCFILN
ncbi:hepatocellular carcinoma-associated antigen 59 [Tanacetum coccineum]